jgi:hypothetical protein
MARRGQVLVGRLCPKPAAAGIFIRQTYREDQNLRFFRMARFC